MAASWEKVVKGELKPEISLLHMKVLTLIKEKSNVLILTTRAPPSWIEFDVVTSQCQTRHLEYGL